jgi:hypothetical protein
MLHGKGLELNQLPGQHEPWHWVTPLYSNLATYSPRAGALDFQGPQLPKKACQTHLAAHSFVVVVVVYGLGKQGVSQSDPVPRPHFLPPAWSPLFDSSAVATSK